MFTKEPFINKVLFKCLDNLHDAQEFYLNEDDFKFSFAQALRECGAQEIILEYPITKDELYCRKKGININEVKDEKRKIDIRFKHGEKEFFVELKYKQSKTVVTRYNQQFTLHNHSAQNDGLYAIHLDIERMEAIKNTPKHEDCLSFCIFITNDKLYKSLHNVDSYEGLDLCHGDSVFYSNKGSIEYTSGKHQHRTLVIEKSYETAFTLFKELSPQSKNSQFWITVIDLQHPLPDSKLPD